MNKEIWKDIKGYEGLYQVSNLGRVRSYQRNKQGRLVNQYYDKRGYKVVTISKQSKLKLCKVHRLVAQAFIPNPEGKPQVNHIDENKGNNCVDNLEWCDNKYNARYGTKAKRAYETSQLRGNNGLIPQKAVIQCNLNGDVIKEYCSVMDAARQLKIDQSSIIKCCRQHRKTAGGYIWKYKEAN